ncbi:MAG: NAD-dependent epimerase/dehydratase family protein, partial [Moorea sp. SIO3I7]|nr:NAD-dependent epimerase/dehydratase family protein [Moorena sp. SIO3I7]
HVQIRLQRGTEHNELNKYRYSVLLHIEAQPGKVITPTVESGASLSVQQIENYLRDKGPESICFSGLVNGRVANDVDLVELLSQPESKQNVQQLRQFLESKPVNGIDPERLHQLSSDNGYSLELCWSAEGSPELMDGVFVRSELAKEGIVLTPLTQKSVAASNWNNYGNNPLSSQFRKELIPQLREYLQSRLPEYMVPSGLMVLSQLPLTPNGKVDRKALPAPDFVSSLSTEYVAPQTETQKVLADIWAEVLGIEKVGIHDKFFELGGHSLLAIQVISRVRAAFSIELKLQDLFESPTVAGVAQAIEKRNDGTQVTNQVKDLRAEVILDSKIQNQSVAFEDITEPKNIFLTGATGFLGVYLLSELLEQTQGNIYCLVRATSSEKGKQRLQRALESYSLWNETKSSRIIPVIGELSAPLLGLDESQFNHLASQMDVIYHNGAWVNFVYSYSVLKPANVLGTHEVLRLASQTKIKPVHFISTMSVFSSSAYSDKQVIFESDSLDYTPDNDDGYAESKWVAEKLVMEARDRGLPVCIYRPGRITGHSQTGFCNTEDLFSRMIKGCIQLGAVPNLEGVFSDIVPVDYVSKAIFNISQQKESLGKAFHMVNPNDIYVNEAFNMIRSWGYPIEQMDYEKWRTKLICQTENSNENALYPLLSLFSEELPVNAEMPRYDCKHTIHGLADTDIVCPSVDSKLLNTYYSYFKSSGFLNAPQ